MESEKEKMEKRAVESEKGREKQVARVRESMDMERESKESEYWY